MIVLVPYTDILCTMRQSAGERDRPEVYIRGMPCWLPKEDPMIEGRRPTRAMAMASLSI